jgi:hypothetical protein
MRRRRTLRGALALSPGVFTLKATFYRFGALGIFIQTREGVLWTHDFNRRRTAVLNDEQRINSKRAELLRDGAKDPQRLTGTLITLFRRAVRTTFASNSIMTIIFLTL